MKAIVITRPGGPDVLEIHELPVPEPLGDQIRVRVRACALNRADLMQCRGYYPAPKGAPADIPGLEYAGEVDALGPNCVGPWKLGDRVFGIVAGGGQAEYLVTHERMAVAIPPALDFEQAAAVPEVFFTALDALESQTHLKPGESVLIHAVGSGIGTAAVQLAHAMGCLTFGTSRSPSKLRLAAELGLDVGIETTSEEFPDVILKHTSDVGVNVILDLIGAPVLADNLRALAMCGRIVVVGLLGGGAGTIDFRPLLAKRATIVGTTLRGRPLEEKIAVTQRFSARVVPWLQNGRVRPIIDRVFPFDAVRKAQERMESDLGFGKIVLRVG